MRLEDLTALGIPVVSRAEMVRKDMKKEAIMANQIGEVTSRLTTKLFYVFAIVDGKLICGENISRENRCIVGSRASYHIEDITGYRVVERLSGVHYNNC